MASGSAANPSGNGSVSFEYPGRVLLITSTLCPAPGMSHLMDYHVRLEQTICALLCWIEQCPSLSTIILCDNSNPTYDFSQLISHAELHGKTLEIFLFRGESFVRGNMFFGEDEIIRYAITHSTFLRKENTFFRVAGKVFVANFEEIQRLHLHLSVVFSPLALWVDENEYHSPVLFFRRLFQILQFGGLRRLSVILWSRLYYWFTRRIYSFKGKIVVTTFYKCSVDFYLGKIAPYIAQKFLEPQLHKVEEEFYTCLEQARELHYFDVKPVLVGLAGSTGIPYRGGDHSRELKKRAREFMQFGNRQDD